MMPYISFKETKSSEKSNSKQKYNLADEVAFENVDYLTSKDLKIDVQNGVSTLGASIYNSSQDLLKNIKCKYTLLDDNNNVVYELTIPILKIDANNYSAFSSISAIDLSSVVDYRVKIAE